LAPETRQSLSARIYALQQRLDRLLDSSWLWVVSLFSKLVAPFKKLVSLIAQKDDTEKKGDGRQEEPSIIPKVVPAQPSNDKPEQCRYPQTPWWKTTAEMVGIVAILVYTVITGVSLSDARKNFIKDQRPYIWNINTQIPHVKLGDKMSWNIQYNNFGRSPAIGVAFRCQIRLVAHNTPELKDMYEPIHKKGYEYEGFIVPPSDSTNWSTCESEEIITQQDLDMMNTYDGGAKLVIFYEYYDTGRNPYTSTVCMFTRRKGTGPIGICPAENNIK
jgi:hypothetical protein